MIIGLYPENLKGKFSRVSSWVSNQRIFVFWFMHVWCNELGKSSFTQSGITWNKIIKYDRARNTKHFLIVDKRTKNIKSSRHWRLLFFSFDKRAARKLKAILVLSDFEQHRIKDKFKVTGYIFWKLYGKHRQLTSLKAILITSIQQSDHESKKSRRFAGPFETLFLLGFSLFVCLFVLSWRC